MNNDPKITFGMIVLNGNPFIKHNLRSLYEFAHQIIVVEGACPAAANVATEDGHSIDGTLETLYAFKNEEDIQNKLTIVKAEDENKIDGFWLEKTEMSAAYAKRATGNYLWQIDSDEFYTPESLRTILDFLSKNPDVTEVSFRTLNFWGGLSYRVDSLLLRLGDQDFHRLFAWDAGSIYVTHRPPTVINSRKQNVAQVKAISANEMSKMGVFLHHYEYLFPHQVRNKAEYYAHAEHCRGVRPENTWAEDCYMKLNRPFRVHNIYIWPSWLQRYELEHPPEIIRMMKEVEASGSWQLRRTDDIELLLGNWFYITGIFLLKLASPFVNLYMNAKMGLRSFLIRSGLWQHVQLFRTSVK